MFFHISHPRLPSRKDPSGSSAKDKRSSFYVGACVQCCITIFVVILRGSGTWMSTSSTTTTPPSARPTTANISINQNPYTFSRFPLISLFTNRQDLSRSRKDSYVSARCYEVVVMSSGSTTLSSSSMRFGASSMYKRFIMSLLKLPLHYIYTHFQLL